MCLIWSLMNNSEIYFLHFRWFDSRNIYTTVEATLAALARINIIIIYYFHWKVRFVRAPPALVRNKHCSVLIFQRSTSDDLVTEEEKKEEKNFGNVSPHDDMIWLMTRNDWQRAPILSLLITAIFRLFHYFFLTNIIFMTISMIIIFTGIINHHHITKIITAPPKSLHATPSPLQHQCFSLLWNPSCFLSV